ncbi:MAG: transposase [Chitinophagaceae bacterium]
MAKKFGYTYRGFTTIVSDFRKRLKQYSAQDPFFQPRPKGRSKSVSAGEAREVVISLRKKYYSVEDIKVTLDSKGLPVSEKTIYTILKQEGFSRLPRRLKAAKTRLEPPQIQAAKSGMIALENEEFKSASAGIITLLPYIEHYGIRKSMEQSGYPETKTISKLNSILSFIALKASDISRYTTDDLWCMDRGAGLFAALNVLPKAAWFTSYSHRVTSKMNRDFLTRLHKIWKEEGLLGDTANLDFTTVPYWGEGDHLENNWSGKRGKALSSLLAVLAHDPDSGIIDYANANVKHSNESAVVLEFLDFYKDGNKKADTLKYLVFDSKFTNYENLNTLNKEGIKFLTIRRRGKNLVGRLNNVAANKWKTIRIEASGNKKRTLKALDEKVNLPGYEGEVRQVSITGNGKIKPAIIISNDTDLPVERIVRKYARRWLVEKAISEQIEFFHLNKVSSSMVIKVDFDLTMSIVTHNLYRLFARDMDRYAHRSDQRIYQEFIKNAADIKIQEEAIIIQLKKKRNLPLIIEKMQPFKDLEYPWLGNKKIHFEGATYS